MYTKDKVNTKPQWDLNYEELKKIRDEGGDNEWSSITDNKPLYQRIGNQRIKYKNYDPGNIKGSMTAERKKKLDNCLILTFLLL